MASALFEKQRNSPDAVAAWTVHLSFPAFFEFPAIDFYWSTAEGGVELADGNFYEHRLASVPRGRQQRDRGNDFAEFTVANPEAEVLDEFGDYQDICEKGVVTICECYEIVEGQGVYEEEIRFYGYIKDFNVDETDHTIKFTAMSDMSRTGFPVGGRILTREKCGTEFNFNGLIDPSVHPCGWQTEQGGNPLFCSKLADGVDGCKAHNNFHRFYAVPALATAEVTIIPNTETGGGGGWDYESGPCFTSRMFMVMDAQLNILPLDQVVQGMRHLGFDIFDNDRLIESEILDDWTHPTDEYWEAKFGLATIEGSNRHLFYTGSRTFMPMGALKHEVVIGMDSAGKRAYDALRSIKRHQKDDLFYQFRTRSCNYIICDKNKQFFYFCHNAKPVLGVD